MATRHLADMPDVTMKSRKKCGQLGRKGFITLRTAHLHDGAQGLVVFRKLLFRGGGPPGSDRAVFGAAAGLSPSANHVVAGGEPEKSLGAQESGRVAVEEIPEAFRMKGPSGAKDKAADAVFLGFGGVDAVQFLDPTGGGLGFFHIETSGVEDIAKGDAAALGIHNAGGGVELVQDGAKLGAFFGTDQVGFVDDEPDPSGIVLGDGCAAMDEGVVLLAGLAAGDAREPVADQ